MAPEVGVVDVAIVRDCRATPWCGATTDRTRLSCDAVVWRDDVVCRASRTCAAWRECPSCGSSR